MGGGMLGESPSTPKSTNGNEWQTETDPSCTMNQSCSFELL